jgi:hypothetical protein
MLMLDAGPVNSIRNGEHNLLCCITYLFSLWGLPTLGWVCGYALDRFLDQHSL